MSKNEGGGVISNPKNSIANSRYLTHIYEFLQKKRNEISKNQEGGWGQRLFGLFPKKLPNLSRPSSLNRVTHYPITFQKYEGQSQAGLKDHHIEAWAWSMKSILESKKSETLSDIV